jgi:branched-chain amino acid transport system ATP-binding protein
MLLNVRKISAGYDNNQILFDISFNIDEGEIVIIDGENGSGKSTLLKCLYGIIKPWFNDSEILFKNMDILNTPVSELSNKGFLYIPQTNNIFENLTVKQNLQISGSCLPKSILKKKEEEILSLTELKNLTKQNAFNLSGGEKQILAISNVLMFNPSLIMFDEPFRGLDENNTLKIKSIILKLSNLGISFLIVDHTRVFFSSASKILIMKSGRFIN